MDEIRTTALRAIDELGPAWHGQGKILQATKVIRERTGCDLRTAIDAAKWAAERPAASALPDGTIVAYSGEPGLLEKYGTDWWATTHLKEDASDMDVDEALRSGRADILRVGEGS